MIKKDIFANVEFLLPEIPKPGQAYTPFQGFGVECGEGWAHIIRDALILIGSRVKRKGYNIVVNQIKEKFGGLRIYLSSEDDFIEGVIRMAEMEAERTCEVCGKEGKLIKRNGWYKTICESCESKFWSRKNEVQ